MKYMFLIYGEESAFNRKSHAQQVETMTAYRTYTENLQKAGVWLGGHRLADVASATTLRTHATSVQVVDGPFAETKEQLGGYYMIEAPDLDAALKWARQCPAVHGGSVEVRPIVEMSQSA